MAWRGQARLGAAWHGRAWHGRATKDPDPPGKQRKARKQKMTATVQVTIEGLSPLMMHAYPTVPIEGLDKMVPEKQAEFAAYRIPETRELYIPAINMQRALVAGAAFSKGKGRATLAKAVAACVMVNGVYLGLGTTDYMIDSRPVVIPATKGRVMRHRPRLDAWKVSFEMSYDDTLLSAKQIRQVVDDTGKNVGILEFRPATKGPLGRFIVTSWEIFNPEA